MVKYRQNKRTTIHQTKEEDYTDEDSSKKISHSINKSSFEVSVNHPSKFQKQSVHSSETEDYKTRDWKEDEIETISFI